MPKSAAPAPKPARRQVAVSPAPAAQEAMPKSGGWLAPALSVALLAAVVSANCLLNGYVTDDEILIRQNRDLDSWSTLGRGFTHYLMLPWVYRPVIFLSYFLDKQLWGANPLGFHLTNLLFHVGVAVLVFWWGAMMLGNRRAAWAGGLLFAVMPIHSESVAWISGRTDVLSAFWYLLALVLFTAAAERARPRWWAYAGSLVVFAVAMLTKEMAATLPVVLALQMACFGQPVWAPRWLPRALLLAPFFGVLGLYFILRSAVIGHVMMSGYFPNANIMTTLQASPLIILWYLWLMLQPSALHLYYQLEGAASAVPLAAVALVLLLAALVYATIRRRREAFWGWWFLASLFPVLLIPTDPRLADHYVYLPTVAVALVGGLLAVRLLDWARTRLSRHMQRVLAGAMIALLVALGAISAQRNRYWEDSVVFYTAMTQQDPTVAIAHSNLGTLLFGRGDREQGLAHLLQAAKLKPDFPEVLDNLAGAYYQLGRYQEAVELYQRVLSRHPRDAKAAIFLAKSLLRWGKPHEALLAITAYGRAYQGSGVMASNLAQVEQALRAQLASKPQDSRALADLGITLDLQGHTEQAVATWQQALRLDPSQVSLHVFLGQGYQRLGNREAARAAYRAYLQAAPDSDIAEQVRARLRALDREQP